MDRWTEEQYNIYSLVELVRGNRKELTPEDRKDIELAEKAESLIESGDPEWLSKIEAMLSEQGIEGVNIDDELLEEIDTEQKLRGE